LENIMNRQRIRALVVLCGMLVTACGPGLEAEEAMSGLGEQQASLTGGTVETSGSAVAKSTVVIFSRSDFSSTFTPKYSGVLVGTQHVLMAVYGTESLSSTRLKVGFGASASSAIQVNVASVTRIATITSTSTNALYLLKLATPAPSGFAPAPLIDSTATLSLGTQLMLAGFGVSDPSASDTGTLRYATGHAITTSFGGSSVTGYPNKMFATYKEGSVACHGDSGAPLYQVSSTTLTVAAVTFVGRCSSGWTGTDRETFSVDLRPLRSAILAAMQ
jgi:hypothetical protein